MKILYIEYGISNIGLHTFLLTSNCDHILFPTQIVPQVESTTRKYTTSYSLNLDEASPLQLAHIHIYIYIKKKKTKIQSLYKLSRDWIIQIRFPQQHFSSSFLFSYTFSRYRLYVFVVLCCSSIVKKVRINSNRKQKSIDVWRCARGMYERR